MPARYCAVAHCAVPLSRAARGCVLRHGGGSKTPPVPCHQKWWHGTCRPARGGTLNLVFTFAKINHHIRNKKANNFKLKDGLYSFSTVFSDLTKSVIYQLRMKMALFLGGCYGTFTLKLTFGKCSSFMPCIPSANLCHANKRGKFLTSDLTPSYASSERKRKSIWCRMKEKGKFLSCMKSKKFESTCFTMLDRRSDS